MGPLRIIWKDILSLNARFTLAVKIAGLLFLIALIIAARHFGADWWNQPFVMKHEARPRWGVALLLLGLGIISYLLWVIDRYRRRR